MKNYLVVLLGLAASAHAATYTIQNVAGFNSSIVVDSTGVALSGDGATNGAIGTVIGSAGFGYFTSDNAVTSATSGATLIDSDFIEFGTNAGLFNPANPFVGLFSRQGTVSGATLDSTFTGQNIYLVISNGSTLSAGTEFLVYKLNATFGASANEPINQTITIDTANNDGTLLLGTRTGPARGVSGSDPSTEPSFQLQAIPEPSAALLGAFGMVGLIRRRRIV